jgi:RNA polymerase sigma-70 factor (ECF subfamily)
VALTLFYFDDMKYTDIAEVLDLPLNTVKSHIRRGKDRLAALLGEYRDEYTVRDRPSADLPPRTASFATA